MTTTRAARSGVATDFAPEAKMRQLAGFSIAMMTTNPHQEFNMRIISFISQKGGVGKSTACVNLAAALAERSYRILLIDLDANACAS